MWVDFIQYGMKRKEFKTVNPEAIFDLIVFSYQGVRMYGVMMDIDTNIPKKNYWANKAFIITRKWGDTIWKQYFIVIVQWIVLF